MTITAILKWENQDSTADLNSKWKALFYKGLLTGGTIVPVSGMLSVDVQPFTCVSSDGMLVASDNSVRLSIPLDQTNIIALHAKYQIADDPILEIVAVEASTFNAYTDKDDYVVFGAVTTLSPSIEVALTDISYVLRNEQDKRGRSAFRGQLTDTLDLPTDPNFIWPGDFYIVAPGGGSSSNIYAWDGLNWNNITATAAISADLAQHRANMFANEIHLSDDQADAALGSSGLPSLTNRYVTESDTRLPTQLENDALQGTDGSPSSSNRYVTEEYPIAVATLLGYPVPPGGSILVASTDGPVFVGEGIVGSANIYFSLLEYATDAGYLNSFGSPVKINGIYKDIFLSVALDPSTDPNVDSYGFFSGSDLYLSVDNVVDTPCRLIYGKSNQLKSLSRSFSVVANPGLEVISGTLLNAIANIKGRVFGDPTPTNEQNINLRIDIDNTAAYIGTVLDTNVIAGNEDYERLSPDPILGTHFEKNIGVPDIYTFDNTSLTSFTYASSTGLIQYGSPVNLSGVRVGDLFRDGAGIFYLVASVNDGSDNLNILDIQTNLYPKAVTTSVGSHVDGSVKINNNPRDLLLSEMKFNYGWECVKISKLVRKPDEFSLPEGQIAYSVVRHDNRFDPRIIFYGGWELYETPTREKYVRNATGNGTFSATGFFTDMALLMRRRNNSPALNVSVDGQTPTLVSTSALGDVNANVSASEGPKYHQVVLASSLPDNRPNTVTVSIAAATIGSLDVYGILLLRTNSEAAALLESGRAFQSARIVKRDAIDDSVGIYNIAAGGRGGRLSYAVKENTYDVAIGSLTDMDSGGVPAGTATGSTVTITSGVGKLNNYRANDIILIYSASNAEIRRISSITSPAITLSSPTSFSGDSVVVKHICTTETNIPFSSDESPAARYVLPDDFINCTSTDFQVLSPQNRFVLSTDGYTLISGQNISVVDSGITGASKAISIDSSGYVRFNALTTRLDLLCVNSASCSIDVSIDGSPNFSLTLTGGMARKTTIFSNARYQSHEITIIPTSGSLAISEIFLSMPKKPEFSESLNEVAELAQPARYIPSFSTLISAPSIYPTGAVFKEAFHYATYLDGSGTGSDWTVSDDFSKSVYGKYINADREGASIEFHFLGTAFELQAITGPDHGIFEISVDGTSLELTGATIVGDYTSNQFDAYSAIYGRKNIGAYGLAYGYHRVVASIQTPRTKHASSSGYNMAFVGFYECNDNGFMSIGVNREKIYCGVIDTRNFIPVDATPLDYPVQITSPLERGGKVNILSSVLSVTVNFTEPFPDTAYLINANLMNSTDAYPEYQPILITAQTKSSFTVSWNSPMPTANYILCYHAKTVD